MCKMFNKYVYYVYFVIVFVNVSAKKYEIPSYVHVCERNYKPLEKCLKRVVEEDIRPRLANGIKEMGIPPLEPLVIPEAALDTGRSFAAKFKNLHVHYATEFVLNNYAVDLDKNEIKLSIYFPRLRLLSDYNIKGRLLILDLNGNGKADGNLTDIKAVAELNGVRFQKNNKEYIDFRDNSIKIQVGKAKFYFENLINANEELSKATNQVINDNIDDIILELKPIIEDTIGTIVFSVTKRVFKNFSIDELFPIKAQ